ncbi:MAG TPA: DUF3313 family protein [Povalibacter sp.]
MTFNRSRGHMAYALTAALLLCGCATTDKSPIDDMSTQDGLVRVDIKGLDSAYKRPNANLTGYDKILLRPLTVSFASNWKPERDSSSALYHMTPPDREKIKKDLADAFADVFREVLQEKGGYQLVAEPAEDVLEVQSAIINLYITAPDVSRQTAGMTRVYTSDAGEMTLVTQLHDSVTGQLLSRVYDRRDDTGGMWQWTTSVSNGADARREIRSWAELLKKALDASRGKTG